jgi:hypothetical protein
MGMYDHYQPDPPLHCPDCNAELSGWQGKAGPCALLFWKQGIKHPVDELGFLAHGPESETLPETFQIYTSCPNCKHWIEAACRGENYVWIQTTISNQEGQQRPECA